MNTQTSNQLTDKYHNLHTTGVGFINRIRTVQPKKGEPFLACTIAALVGKASDKEKQYYDVRVSGEEAKQLIERCLPAQEGKKSIFTSFVVGDAYPDLFTYPEGHAKAGQTGVTMKGRLLLLKSIFIDGELVWKRSVESEDTSNREVAEDIPEPAPSQYTQAENSVPADIPPAFMVTTAHQNQTAPAAAF